MLKIIYLDVDGVLNDHSRHENMYSGLTTRCVDEFNVILREEPDAKIVFTSAWRYFVLRGDMTLNGLEGLFLTHGLDCKDRVIGITLDDERYIPNYADRDWISRNGIAVREKQIMSDVATRQSCSLFVVLDDLELRVPRFVQTDGEVGLTAREAQLVLELLR